MAQRLRGGGVCHSSPAGGIGGLDCRAQGCAERGLLHAHFMGLCALCTRRAYAYLLHPDGNLICLGSYVQGHAGDAAICASPSGLLAARTIEGGCSRWQTDSIARIMAASSLPDPGKDSALPTCRRKRQPSWLITRQLEMP